MVFAGIGRRRCGFLANCFCDSSESEAVIPCPRDDEGGRAMRPRERQETGEQDLFRSRLDRIIDLTHALVKLSRAIDWRFFEAQFGSVYSDGPGCPPLPTQLMAGLALLKHMYDLSDEVLCDRWIENPYFQFFCGEEFFQHRLPFDREESQKQFARKPQRRRPIPAKT